MRKPIEKIVIVGGGTAGWLSAIHLTRFWKPRRRGPRNIEVTVIESPELPIVGVGEATTGLFTTFIRGFSNEREFLRETKASFKLGILHRDWGRKGDFYLGPLNDERQLGIPAVAPETTYPYFFAASLAEGEPAWKNMLNSELMLRQKAPYSRIPGRAEASAWDYAYHFDTHRVGAYLRERTEGVRHLSGTVRRVNGEPGTGYVRSVTLDSGQEVAGDLFIDCTGFSRLIIGKHYGEEWISHAEHLPANRALPFSIPHEDGRPIPSYTHAWALSAGWLWQIPTQDRLGCGYVYSDQFTNADRAQAEVEETLGHPIEPWGDIKIDPGRFRRLWIKNCLAIGLSGAFAEPLESTSIHGQLVQLRTFVLEYLTDEFDFDATPVLDSYNRRMGQMYDDFRDFLVVHYQGGRDDSDFWRSVTINDSARERLELWRLKTPITSDVDQYLGAIDIKLWLYTLDGLGLLDPDAARRELDYYGLWAEANRARGEQRRRMEAFTRHAVSHAAYLEEVSESLAAPPKPGQRAAATSRPPPNRPPPNRAARRGQARRR